MTQGVDHLSIENDLIGYLVSKLDQGLWCKVEAFDHVDVLSKVFTFWSKHSKQVEGVWELVKRGNGIRYMRIKLELIEMHLELIVTIASRVLSNNLKIILTFLEHSPDDLGSLVNTQIDLLTTGLLFCIDIFNQNLKDIKLRIVVNLDEYFFIMSLFNRERLLSDDI